MLPQKKMPYAPNEPASAKHSGQLTAAGFRRLWQELVDLVTYNAHVAATAVHGATGAVVGTTNTQTLTNKTLDATNTITLLDTLFTLQDNTTPSKQLRFELSGLTAATTRTLTVPDLSDTLVLLTATQTLTNKTLTTPTIASFTNAQHNHQNAAGGGTLDAAAIAAGVLAAARLPAASGAAQGAMSAADFNKVATIPPERGSVQQTGNVALNNVGYTTIMSSTVTNAGTYTVVAHVSLQQTPAGSAQSTRIRLRINGVDVMGAYSYIAVSGFMSMSLSWRGAIGAGQSIAIVGLVGTGSVTALQDMPDGAGLRANNLTWF